MADSFTKDPSIRIDRKTKVEGSLENKMVNAMRFTVP